MKEYLIGLIICSIFATVIVFISPSDRLLGHQKFIAGLCIICVMIKPAAGMIDFIRELDITLYIPGTPSEEYQDQWEDYLKDYGEGAIKDYISTELEGTFGVSARKVSVSYKNDTGEPSVEKIYIELPLSAAFKDTAKIEVYFEKIFDCEIITAIAEDD